MRYACVGNLGQRVFVEIVKRAPQDQSRGGAHRVQASKKTRRTRAIWGLLLVTRAGMKTAQHDFQRRSLVRETIPERKRKARLTKIVWVRVGFRMRLSVILGTYPSIFVWSLSYITAVRIGHNFLALPCLVLGYTFFPFTDGISDPRIRVFITVLCRRNHICLNILDTTPPPPSSRS